jgi:hypothetical protein
MLQPCTGIQQLVTQPEQVVTWHICLGLEVQIYTCCHTSPHDMHCGLSDLGVTVLCHCACKETIRIGRRTSCHSSQCCVTAVNMPADRSSVPEGHKPCVSGTSWHRSVELVATQPTKVNPTLWRSRVVIASKLRHRIPQLPRAHWGTYTRPRACIACERFV